MIFKYFFSFLVISIIIVSEKLPRGVNNKISIVLYSSQVGILITMGGVTDTFAILKNSAGNNSSLLQSVEYRKKLTPCSIRIPKPRKESR